MTQKDPTKLNEGKRDNLTTDDWASAALDAIADDGADAVAVEPLARRLGVTKGSFYWHFANREALLTAALTLWEKQETEEVFEHARHETHPARRLYKLFAHAKGSVQASRIYMALASSHNERIREFVRRVSERRLQFIYECYRGLGFSVEEAERWATLAYSVYLGTMQQRRDMPEGMDEDQYHEYVRFVIGWLIPEREQALSLAKAG